MELSKKVTIPRVALVIGFVFLGFPIDGCFYVSGIILAICLAYTTIYYFDAWERNASRMTKTELSFFVIFFFVAVLKATIEVPR